MNVNQKKLCPFLSMTPQHASDCVEEECAWWCEWTDCCALVAIPAEISDRLSEIRQAGER